MDNELIAYKPLPLKNGFSLMELMISLVIVGVLALASVPMLRQWLVENRLTAAAETFATQFRAARSEAISRQQSVYVNVQTGNNWCYGSNVSSSCTCSPNNCSLSTQAGSFYPNVSVTTTGFSSDTITIDSTRGLLSATASVSFTADNKTITVNLSRLGLVSLCSADVSGYSAC